MILLPEYHNNDTVYDNGTTYVYRADSIVNNTKFIIKTLKSDYPTTKDIKRIHNEYDILQSLDIDGIVRIQSLIEYKNKPFLILHDIGGYSLSDFIKNNSCTLDRFFTIALPLVLIIKHIHYHNIIHKDINPYNIIYNNITNQIELIDFGLASRLSQEYPYLTATDQIEGTFAYLAPEQTGRMNRLVDYRCDFYALGTTFYQLLTGQLPFQANDPLEWVHCHVARIPRPLTDYDPMIPSQLSDLILKLLAKVPEERYQSAQGLHHDLKQCELGWKTKSAIEPFTLGQGDISAQFRVSQKLYGRDDQLAQLTRSLERMRVSGKPELAIVTGPAGIGKSAFVSEIHKSMNGLFIMGKGDQYRQNIPYAAIGAAFETLVQHLLSHSEERLTTWTEHLQAAVGPNGQILIDLIPHFELIIGPQQPVAQLPFLETQARLHLVFQKMMSVVCTSEHPLILFLDDLQWVDSSSFQLLKYLLSSDTFHWLVIGAYRNSEVDTAHPLLLFLDEIRANDVPINTFLLTLLTSHDLQQLMVDTLYRDAEAVNSLVDIVLIKTLGNPFFSIQFLTMLYRERLIVFDQENARWDWDLETIKAQNFTDNVLELMLQELKRLPSSTQEALWQGACLGTTFNLEELALIRGCTREELIRLLWTPADRGLLLFYQDNVRFLHDRVHVVAYHLMDEERRTELHLHIGRFLLRSVAPEQLGEHLFRIVNHLNQGSMTLIESTERIEFATLNLQAGMRARSATAYAAALGYLTVGITLLGSDRWTTHYDLLFSLLRYRAECEYLQGNMATAEALITQLEHHVQTTTDTLIVARTRVGMYAMQGRYDELIAHSIECLQLADVNLTLMPTMEVCHQSYNAVWQALGPRSIESLTDLPPMTDPEKQEVMTLLSALQAPVAASDVNLLFMTQCYAVRLSITDGNTQSSAYMYLTFGFLMGVLLNEHRLGYRFAQMGYELAQCSTSSDERAKVYGVFGGVINPWIHHIRTSIPILRQAFTFAVDDGDLLYACYACNWLNSIHLATGLYLEDFLNDVQRHHKFIEKNQVKMVEISSIVQRQLIQRLIGNTDTFSTFDGPGFIQSEFEDRIEVLSISGSSMGASICTYWVYKLIACYWSGQYQEALIAADKARESLWQMYNTSPVEYFYFRTLTLTAMYSESYPKDQEKYQGLINEAYEKFHMWSDNSPETFQHRYMLIKAEISRIENNILDAEQYYEKAIHIAQENGFVHHEGIACEVTSRFYGERGFDQIAKTYMRMARDCYDRWGAKGKVRHLDATYPYLRDYETTANTTSNSTSLTGLDSLAIVKASQAISSNIILSQLLERLLQIVLEQAGAQHADLLLVRNGKLVVAATAHIEQHVRVFLDPTDPLTSGNFPLSILNYVLRSHEPVLLTPEDPTMFQPYADDPYLHHNPPKSLLCIPIIRQTTVLGLIYLEHNLIAHAFAPLQIDVLHMLASQAAISLENALLYDQLEEYNRTLEQKVLDRTADLNTALKQLELHTNELKRTNIRLEGLLHFARFMQHEVRGYAAGLEGLMPLLHQALDSHPQGEYHRDRLEALGETIEQMNDLTHRMLILTREGVLPQQQCRAVPLHALFERVCIKTVAFANRYDLPVRITQHIPTDLVVMGDPLYLELAFFTGLRNAVEVLAEYEVIEEAQIEINAFLADGSVHVQISDNGPGFPIALLETIYLASQDEGHFVIGWSSKTGGSGLGLALIDRVVRLHKGTLIIRNHNTWQTSGAWIYITLPIDYTVEMA